MPKKVFLVLTGLILMVCFSCASNDQATRKANEGMAKAWKKTVTLPNGDVILDMNGEWDARIENYGPNREFGSYPQIIRVTQNGSTFVSIRMIEDPWHAKGSPAIEGELNKEGFKNVYIMSGGMGPFSAEGKISEDGNKIEIDDGQKARCTLIRK
jgi:hypothetical protein